MKEFSLSPGSIPAEASDVLLHLHYDGNVAELFLDGKKVADQYSLGNGWQIGLKRFGEQTSYTLRVFALDERAAIYMDNPPAFRHGLACELHEAAATAEYTVTFSI